MSRQGPLWDKRRNEMRGKEESEGQSKQQQQIYVCELWSLSLMSCYSKQETSLPEHPLLPSTTGGQTQENAIQRCQLSALFGCCGLSLRAFFSSFFSEIGSSHEQQRLSEEPDQEPRHLQACANCAAHHYQKSLYHRSRREGSVIHHTVTWPHSLTYWYIYLFIIMFTSKAFKPPADSTWQIRCSAGRWLYDP